MYTDEKRPDGEYVYEVIPVQAVEEPEPKPKRPLWRRVLRAFLAFTLISMLFNAFVPMPHCHHTTGDISQPHHPHVRPHLTERPKMEYSWPRGLKDFKIKQGSLSVLPSLVYTVGSVKISSSKAQQHISVKFNIDVSDDSLLDKIKITPSKNGIEFATDAVVLTKQRCNITAIVVMPEGKVNKLSTFQAEVKELDIILDSFNTIVNGSYFETTSGNVTAYGDGEKDILFSPYVSAKSTSGSIRGRFPLGYVLEAETATGEIALEVTAAPWDEKAKLKTLAGTGETHVTFVNDVSRAIVSSHKSGTGGQFVTYPEGWQGKIKGTSGTGTIDFVGDNFQETGREETATSRMLKGIKGNGDSYCRMISVSGKIEAILGKWSDRPGQN